jgi:hypothetical protein
MPGYPLRDRASGVTVLGMSDMDVVFLVIALIGLGVGLISVPKHPPFWLAKVCFILAAIVFSARWVMWGITTDWSLWPRLTVMAIIGAFALIGATEGLRWVDVGQKANREEAMVPDESNPSLPLISQAQFEKISQLEEFIGGRDEWALRSLFDLPSVLQKNINTQVIRICFIKSGHEKDFLYSNYTDNRSWIMWAKERHYSTGPSGANVDAGRKDVLFLVTTTKIQEAQRKLIEFMNSSLIQHSINVEISAFNDV